MRKMTVLTLATIFLVSCIGMIATVPETVLAVPSANEFRINDDAGLALEADSGSGTEGDPWVIENRVIDGYGLNYAMYIGNTTEYLEIRNCTVNHTTEVHSFPYYVSAGIHLFNVDNVRVTNTTVYDAQTYGIYASNRTTYITIDNCTLWNNTDRGIAFDAAYDGIINDNNIYCNDTSNNGITFNRYSDHHTVGRNYIERALWCGIVVNDTWNATFHNNEVLGNISDMGPDGNISTQYGMLFYNSWWINANNNTITDCEVGMFIGGTAGTLSTQSEIAYNNIVGCYDIGLYIDYSDDILITRNDINNPNGYLGEPRYNTAVLVASDVTNVNITYNTIYNYDVGINVTTEFAHSGNNCYAHNNRFTTNTLHAWSDAADALFQFWCEDTGKGNWWDDWTYVHGGDADRDGIVDTPRDIPGAGSAIDTYPQTTVPALPVTPLGGGGGGGTPAPVLDATNSPDVEPASLNISFGIWFWIGGLLLLLGFAHVPVPYVTPLILKVGGVFLIILNFIL